jgi:hypothetical protein
MQCLHPSCPAGNGLSSWEEVVEHPSLKIQQRYKGEVLDFLEPIGTLDTMAHNTESTLLTSTYFKRLLDSCPCLFAQLDVRVTAKAVVHLCETTLGAKITSANVYDAFMIQHPATDRNYSYSPRISGAGGGDIMEALCSEVLSNHGIPEMTSDSNGYPEWKSQSHLSLNGGKMTRLKLYGDLLIPAAPHNILVSVKSETARERFVLSGNRLESVGFGFFNDPSEFWTENRMNLLKRWGFIAVYMPQNTLRTIETKLEEKGICKMAININGEPLYRPLECFGDDMYRIAGKLSMNL